MNAFTFQQAAVAQWAGHLGRAALRDFLFPFFPGDLLKAEEKNDQDEKSQNCEKNDIRVERALLYELIIFT